MGNDFSVSRIPKPKSIVVIKHDQYSKDQDIPNDVMRIGQKAMVIDNKIMYQSRPGHPKISITRVKFADGHIDTYFTINLHF